MTEAVHPGPGSLMDTLIAQRVFGWHRADGDGAEGKEDGHQRRSLWFKDAQTVAVACDECGTMPAFSTSLEAAAQIIEEAHRRGWSVDLHSRVRAQGLKGPAVEWLVDFIPPRLQFPPHSTAGKGPTLPAAICVAALLAFA